MTDKLLNRNKSSPFPRYLHRTQDYVMMPKNVFVIYLGVKSEPYGMLIAYVYSFIHEGIVWKTRPIPQKPKHFLAKHVAPI